MEQAYSSDIAFSPAVKCIQAHKGSRPMYARQEQDGSWATEINDDIRAFIQTQTSVYLATSSKAGQPYVQHRGGPVGFLQVLDRKTLAFADFAGNRQYITQGNLSENPRSHLFLIDYTQRRRVKIWGTARFVEDDAPLLKRLVQQESDARPERVVRFSVAAWDENCPRHIPQRLDASEVWAVLALRDARIESLQRELVELKATFQQGPISKDEQHQSAAGGKG